ncbi:MAG: AAA family ATPase [Candidatus Nitrotoga sp.]
MKLSFENLGAIEYAEIELAELTVVCGENNTGKTYVTYLIYCLLTTWRKFIDIDLKRDLLSLKEKGVVKINLHEKVADQWPKLCSNALGHFLNTFPEMMASKSELFSQLTVHLDIPLGLAWKEREFKNELRSGTGNLLVTMSKPAKSAELELVALKSDELSSQSMVSLGEFIEERLFGMMLEETVPDVFIASTERTGATTFRKQLNLATSNIIELLSQSHKEGADSITPDRVFETIYGRQDYALPVRRNVQFVNQLPDTNSEDGDLYKSAPGLLKRFESIVGGTYATSKDGVTYFQPSGTKLKLGLGEVSSSVRSLLIVWYWLKYFAKKGDMLMLDEPELNLHPANQRRLARFIVALINHGVKVFITTHSDYIVKEFNTLIMFNQEDKRLNSVREKYKEYLPEDKLAYDKVSLYMARDEKVLKQGYSRKTKIRTLVRANISQTLGIEAISFDETIDEMNAIQEAIYYGIN